MGILMLNGNIQEEINLENNEFREIEENNILKNRIAETLNASRNNIIEDEDAAYLFLSVLSSVFFSIFPSLVMIALRRNITAYGKSFLYKTLNFELLLVLAAACVRQIHFFGHWFLFALFILNFVSCIRAANCVNSRKDFDYPLAINFIERV